MERVDAIITKLETALTLEKGKPIKFPVSDLVWLSERAKEVLENDPINIPLKAPITVCGDIHGQFYDFLSYFKNHTILEEKKFLFLGDYVDRGQNSIEIITYLFALKVRYPDRIWLLRGNHETREISSKYGFREECTDVYGKSNGNTIWEAFIEAFLYLPLSAVISDHIFCVHGGLSPELKDISDIEDLDRPLYVPESGLVCDLLWADPDYNRFGFNSSPRGLSFVFGKDTVEKFLEHNNFGLLCRAHQQVDKGYEYPFHPDNSVLTIFSAPNYSEGAVLDISQDLTYSFTFIKSLDQEM